MMRTRAAGSTLPICVEASSANPSCLSQRRAWIGVDATPANMSSSPTTPATVMSACGSLTSGASTRATVRRKSRLSVLPSIVTRPVSGVIRPLAISPSTVGRCCVSARAKRTTPVWYSRLVVGRASPLLTSWSVIFMRRPPAARERRGRSRNARRADRRRHARTARRYSARRARRWPRHPVRRHLRARPSGRSLR